MKTKKTSLMIIVHFLFFILSTLTTLQSVFYYTKTRDIGQLSPTTLFGGGLFKIINGEIHRIYTVFYSAPYGMKHGW
ncbi:MAG: hypothetical protein JW927_11470 [Deltaproteobacteria bacterium]|nr:hypothetical protein [Deltaproteobacteria bacterium]